MTILNLLHCEYNRFLSNQYSHNLITKDDKKDDFLLGILHGKGLHDGHVGEGGHVDLAGQEHLECGFESRFIQTWEGSSGVCRLELCHR